ncbi:hypothetical protein ACJX0J_018586, partial [Zea mays]
DLNFKQFSDHIYIYVFFVGDKTLAGKNISSYFFHNTSPLIAGRSIGNNSMKNFNCLENNNLLAPNMQWAKKEGGQQEKIPTLLIMHLKMAEIVDASRNKCLATWKSILERKNSGTTGNGLGGQGAN